MIVTEPVLRRIYTTVAIPRMIMVACVCGGRIRGDRCAPTTYVQAHNRSNRHRAWREARELMREKGV